MATTGNNRLRTEIRWVNAKLAAHLRLTCHYERQRTIADMNVKRLASEMEHGNFIPGTTIYLAVLPDRSMLIMNGNHTLEAIIRSGIPQELVFIYLEVSSPSEAARLYGTFDIHKTRSWLDALKALGADEEIAMPTKSMPAVGLIQQGFRPSKANVDAHYSRNARWDAMAHYRKAAALFHACLAGCASLNRNVLTRSGVMAVALYTLRYQEKSAIEFWEGAAQDNGLEKGDPRKTLLQHLVSTKVEGGKAATVWANAAMAAWNAWARGESLHVIQTLEDPAILGTPFGSDRAKAKAAKPRARHRSRQEDTVPEPDHANGDGLNLDVIFHTGIETTGAGTRPVTYATKR